MDRRLSSIGAQGSFLWAPSIFAAVVRLRWLFIILKKKPKIERQFWRTVGDTPIKDYQEIDEDAVMFPEAIGVAYAVCSKACGNAEFIVDGSSQICDRCGKIMFRTAVKVYVLPDPTKPIPKVIPDTGGSWVEAEKPAAKANKNAPGGKKKRKKNYLRAGAAERPARATNI